MTNKELMEKLNKVPANATVELLAVCGYENIEGEIENMEYNEKENKVVVY